MTPTPLPPLVRTLAEEAISTARLLTEADAIQWESSPVPRPREDTTERASGGHSDPTLNTVADERRLAVRSALADSRAALEETVDRLRAYRLQLESAIDAWSGDYA